MMTTRIRTLSAALLMGYILPQPINTDGEQAYHTSYRRRMHKSPKHISLIADGTLSDGGKLNVAVDLSSVNTAIDIFANARCRST